MKMTVIWDVALCSLAEVYRRFRGAYCLHHHRPDVHNTNAYGADHVCPSVRMFQLENGSTEFYEILYEWYLSGCRPKLVP
jgi:hypothetical protein